MAESRVSRLGSTLGALMLLAGIPVVLVRWAGWPLPDRWPTGQQWRQWLEQPLTAGSVRGAVAVVAWLFWLVLLYALVAEIVLRSRHAIRWLRRLPRLPLPTPMQGLAGGMLGAVAVTAHTAAPAPVAAVSTADGAMLPPGQGADAGTPVQSGVGVQLPDGGWLPRPVAAMVEAAAALVWWRRRQQYRARPPAGFDRDDPDLAPLPATVASIQSGLRDGGTPAHEERLLDLGGLPAGGLGLTGPGAGGAARGALVTLLLGHPPDTGPRQPRIVTTAGDLTTLLGARPHTPGLHVAATLADGLAALEQIVIDPARREHPVTVLTAAPDDPALTARLAALLRLGAGHGISGLILGAWPHGTTWYLDPDGATDAGTRLCTLTGPAAADLLAVVALRVREPARPHSRASHHDAGTPRPATPPGDAPPVQVRLLDRIAVTAGGKPVPIPRTAALQVLAYLALHPGGATSRQLGIAIWPHLRPHVAAGRCHHAVSVLRTALRTASGGHDVVVRAGEHYTLDHTVIDIDVVRLREAVQHAATALAAAERDRALHAVIDVYRGELVTAQRWPWLVPHREAIRRHVIDAYTRLAADHPAEAVELLQKAVRVDPLNEHLHQHAVRALTAAGHHAEATALADRHTRELAAAGLLPSRSPHAR
ncbi:BTAD domain-containing putative transcriptional regulator [Actinomycetes bacterium KLBMP 9797]